LGPEILLKKQEVVGLLRRFKLLPISNCQFVIITRLAITDGKNWKSAIGNRQ